jgi:hypothetical protein
MAPKCEIWAHIQSAGIDKIYIFKKMKNSFEMPVITGNTVWSLIEYDIDIGTEMYSGIVDESSKSYLKDKDYVENSSEVSRRKKSSILEEPSIENTNINNGLRNKGTTDEEDFKNNFKF